MAMVYDYNAGIKAPKLRLDDGCSLAELRNFALRAGFKGVMKYNNKEAILRDIYRHINVVREERKAPDDRVKKHTRVTDAYRDVNDIADIFGFSGRGDIYDFETATGLFHRAAMDGYLSEGLIPSSEDVFVIEPLIKKYGLEEGDVVSGRYIYCGSRDQYALVDVVGINGMPVASFRRADAANAVPPAKRLPVWGGAYLSAVGALVPVMAGETLLVTHTDGFDASGVVGGVVAAAARVSTEPEIIRIDIAPAGAGRGTVMRLDLDPSFFSEAFRVAAARAVTLRDYGRDVILAVTNASAAALGRDITGLYALLSASGNSDAGCVTVVCSMDAAALSPAQLSAARLAASGELAVTDDGFGGYAVDYARCRYKGAAEPEQAAAMAAFRRYLAQVGRDKAAEALRTGSLTEFIDDAVTQHKEGA